MTSSIVKGAWLGFCIAAPVGPIGALVLRQSLKRGHWAGLSSGLGAALADLIYGLLAVAGVRLVAGYARLFAVIGGFVLVCLACKSWRETSAKETAVPKREGLLISTATTFVLTISNPMTILSFGAMVVSTGTDAPAHFVLGVFLGSMLWWTILSMTAAWLGRLTSIRGVVLNRLAAVTLASFGVWAIWSKGLK